MRTEGVPQNVNAAMLQPCRTRRMIDVITHVLLRRRLAVLTTEHKRSSEMSCCLQRLSQFVRHRHAPNAVALRHPQMAFPE